MKKNGKNKNYNAISVQDGIIYEINWKTVSKLSNEEKRDYFKNLCDLILREPVTKPVKVWLDTQYYTVNTHNQEVFAEAYQEYKTACLALAESTIEDSSFEVDWEAVKSLALSKRVVFLEKMLKSIEKAPLEDVCVLRDEQQAYHIVNRRDKALYEYCLKILKDAQNGVDTFAKDTSKYKKKPKTKKPKKEKKDFLAGIKKQWQESSERRRAKKEARVKKNYGGLIGFTSILVGAAMLASYVVNSGALEKLLDGKNKEKGKNPKEAIEDIITNPMVKRNSEEFIEELERASEQRLEELYNAEAKEPDNRSPREKLLDEYLEEYCLYFNMDSTKAIEIARTLTHDYEDSFLDAIGNYLYDLSDDEAAAMIFTYLLSRDELTTKLGNFGMTKESLFISDEVVNYDPDEMLVLRNGESFWEFLGRTSDLLRMDKNYSLAIAYTIAGLDGNPGFDNNNNFSGLKDADGQFIVYPSAEAGIISYLIGLKQYEEKNVCSLEELSGLYVNGDREKPSEQWIASVNYFYDHILNNPTEFFEGSMEQADKVLQLEETTHN